MGSANSKIYGIQSNSNINEVAEHSFQVPMPNSALLLNYLCFGTHFWQESRLTILAKVCAVAMAMGLVKNKA